MSTTSRSPRNTRRPVGRPSGDDRDLRAHLLDTAARQFACTGVAATSLKAIAQAAEVTPAMLHYYFGGKQALVQALIGERLMPALLPVREAVAAAGEEPLALATAFASGIAGVIERHPWLPALWVREVLCEGGALREIMVRQVIPTLPQMLAGRFAAAQAAGRLPAGVDPRLLVVSLVGLTLFPAAGAPIWRQAFGMEGLDAADLVPHTLALLAHGLGLPHPETSP